MNPIPPEQPQDGEQRHKPNRDEMPPRAKDWRRTIGMFANDVVFEEILRRGREWRERDKPKR